MAQNVFFYDMNKAMADALNEIDVVVWGTKEAKAQLNKDIAKAKSAIAEAEKDGTTLTADSAEKRALKVLEDKRKAVNTYYNTMLFGTKDTIGLLEYVGLDETLYNAYVEMQDFGKIKPYESAIRAILEKWEIVRSDLSEESNKRNVTALVSRLERMAGVKVPTDNKIRKGDRVTVLSSKDFFKIFSGALLQIVAKKSNDVVIHDSETYDVTVEYDATLAVTSLKAVVKEEEAQA